MNADNHSHSTDRDETRAERSDCGSYSDGERRERTARPNASGDPLGPPLNITDVAALLGCSEWTIRQRYMRDGLPYLRASSHGKLVFFRDQVIAWILKRQNYKKGGPLR